MGVEVVVDDGWLIGGGGADRLVMKLVEPW